MAKAMISAMGMPRRTHNGMLTRRGSPVRPTVRVPKVPPTSDLPAMARPCEGRSSDYRFEPNQPLLYFSTMSREPVAPSQNSEEAGDCDTSAPERGLNKES